MFDTVSDAVAALDSVVREPLLALAERNCGPFHDAHDVAALLPHRDAALLIDAITCVDPARGLIACRCTGERLAPLLAGHFPGAPVWPGVLHVEAIGQAGLCLARLGARARGEPEPGFMLTHVLGARFMRRITPSGGPVDVVARVVPDGLFDIVIGQCLQNGAVCSAAVVRGTGGEEGS